MHSLTDAVEHLSRTNQLITNVVEMQLILYYLIELIKGIHKTKMHALKKLSILWQLMRLWFFLITLLLFIWDIDLIYRMNG